MKDRTILLLPSFDILVSGHNCGIKEAIFAAVLVFRRSGTVVAPKLLGRGLARVDGGAGSPTDKPLKPTSCREKDEQCAGTALGKAACVLVGAASRTVLLVISSKQHLT